MVIFAVIFAIFFWGIKKTGNSYFFPKSTFIIVQQYGAQKDHYCAHLVKSIKLGILIV